MLQEVAPFTCSCFAGAVIMPNLVSSVDTLAKMRRYREEIDKAAQSDCFAAYMTLFFRPYSRAELLEAKDEIIGIKLYPAGITTRSENGVADFNDIDETLALMEELQIPLLVHGESNGFVLDREKEFLTIYQRLAESFPSLHIIMEHITTAAAVDFLERHQNVSATLTLHHLLITLDDVVGGLLQPDLFCKPIAKRPDDRLRLREAVFSGHERIMFGSDSAPHPRHKKECCGCAAGIFSAPVALPMLAELFEEADRLELLQNFTSGNACQRYGLQPPAKSVTLEKKPWIVPELCGTVKPFLAGRQISWSITNTV